MTEIPVHALVVSLAVPFLISFSKELKRKENSV